MRKDWVRTYLLLLLVAAGAYGAGFYSTWHLSRSQREEMLDAEVGAPMRFVSAEDRATAAQELDQLRRPRVPEASLAGLRAAAVVIFVWFLRRERRERTYGLALWAGFLICAVPPLDAQPQIAALAAGSAFHGALGLVVAEVTWLVFGG